MRKRINIERMKNEEETNWEHLKRWSIDLFITI